MEFPWEPVTGIFVAERNGKMFNSEVGSQIENFGKTNVINGVTLTEKCVDCPASGEPRTQRAANTEELLFL